MNLPHHSKSSPHPARRPWDPWGPARTMLEVDFQVGLRRDSWPSLPRRSCFSKNGVRSDFHRSLKKMSGKLHSKLDFWKLREINKSHLEAGTCWNFKGRRFKTSFFTSPYVTLSSLNGSSFFGVQKFQNCCQAKAHEAWRRRWTNALRPRVQTHLSSV